MARPRKSASKKAVSKPEEPVIDEKVAPEPETPIVDDRMARVYGEGENQADAVTDTQDSGAVVDEPETPVVDEPAKSEKTGNRNNKNSSDEFPAEFEIDNQTRVRIVVAGAIVQPYSKEVVFIRNERDLKRCEVNCEQLARLNKGEITVQRA